MEETSHLCRGLGLDPASNVAVVGTGVAVMSPNPRKSGTLQGTVSASLFSSIFPHGVLLSHCTAQRLEMTRNEVGVGGTPQVALESQPWNYEFSSN